MRSLCQYHYQGTKASSQATCFQRGMRCSKCSFVFLILMFVIRFNGVPNFIRYDCFDWVCSSDLGTVLDTKRVFSVRWLMTVLVSPEVTPCGCRVTLCGCRVTPCGWFPRAHVHVVGMLRFMSKTLTNRTCPHFKKNVLVPVSVFMALSTVFHSINSPDNSPLFHSVLVVLFLPHRSC